MTDELLKPKCPYCDQPLELDIWAFYCWSIRAKCKACRREIDFGFKQATRILRKVKCLACGEEFWNNQLVRGRLGAHCPFCGKHKWEFLQGKARNVHSA